MVMLMPVRGLGPGIVPVVEPGPKGIPSRVFYGPVKRTYTMSCRSQKIRKGRNFRVCAGVGEPHSVVKRKAVISNDLQGLLSKVESLRVHLETQMQSFLHSIMKDEPVHFIPRLMHLELSDSFSSVDGEEVELRIWMRRGSVSVAAKVYEEVEVARADGQLLAAGCYQVMITNRFHVRGTPYILSDRKRILGALESMHVEQRALAPGHAFYDLNEEMVKTRLLKEKVGSEATRRVVFGTLPCDVGAGDLPDCLTVLLLHGMLEDPDSPRVKLSSLTLAFTNSGTVLEPVVWETNTADPLLLGGSQGTVTTHHRLILVSELDGGAAVSTRRRKITSQLSPAAAASGNVKKALDLLANKMHSGVYLACAICTWKHDFEAESPQVFVAHRSMVTNEFLARCARLYNVSFGRWGPGCANGLLGKAVSTTAEQLEREVMFDDHCYVSFVVTGGGHIVGCCFCRKFPYMGEKAMWITLMVVKPLFQGMHCATRMIREAMNVFENLPVAVGINTFHPYAVRALESAVRERLRLGFMAVHAAAMINASEVPRIQGMQLEDYSINTGFFVDNTYAAKTVKSLGKQWRLGDSSSWLSCSGLSCERRGNRMMGILVCCSVEGAGGAESSRFLVGTAVWPR